MGCGASKSPSPAETFEQKMQRIGRQVEERDLILPESTFVEMPAERVAQIEQKRQPQAQTLL